MKYYFTEELWGKIEEVLFQLKRKMFGFKLIIFLFSIYGIASVVLLKDIILLRFQLLIFINLCLLYINERKIQKIKLSFKAIFGLYTTSEGTCTGIVETTHGENSSRPLFKVYVTNYERKEEISFKVLDYCYLSEMENVVILHSAITKRVIKVQGRIENFI